MSDCEFCNQKLKFESDNVFDKYRNAIELAEGGWTALYQGLDKQGKYVLYACGDDYTDDCVINFCPFCGRKL